MFCGVWHTFSADAVEQTMLTDSYREFIRASYREGVNTCAGAGAIGAVACWYPYVWLGKWGAAIALTAVLAVIAILVNGRTKEEIRDWNPRFIKSTALEIQLSGERIQGVTSVIQQIKSISCSCG